MKAIEWAKQNGADIISLSLGFHSPVPGLREALQNVIFPDADETWPVLVFAAAGNWGRNYPRAFPSDVPGVFCIYASDGNGYGENINPQEVGENSFMTLGVAIESAWQRKRLLLSGTSYATPIAVSIAANVLSLAKHNMSLSRDRSKRLRSFLGMRSVLRLMTLADRNFNYLCPWQLEAKGIRSTQQIEAAIKRALDLG
jgi:subtilisin family serine protease